MDEYYGLRYKSSPEKVSYVLHKSEGNLDILGSLLSLQKMGIKLDDNGDLSVPKCFLPPVQITKTSALEFLTKNNALSIERLVEKL